MRQNDEERIYLNYLHQAKCCRMISPTKSVITLRVRLDKVKTNTNRLPRRVPLKSLCVPFILTL